MTSSTNTGESIANIIGGLPYRMAFAGGWIDQPFVSEHDPDPPGSMVVVALKPTYRFMSRCGMGTSTRQIAIERWADRLPNRDPMDMVKELYRAENEGKVEPSGSQDMIGIIYPGVNRLDYAYDHEDGIYPVHIESSTNPEIARWLERVVSMVPIGQRPDGYYPLGIKNLDPGWIRRLGNTGTACYDAILARDIRALGASMNACMACWEAILPHTVQHPTLRVDLKKILKYYQTRYEGAMYSGCGGGYLYVISEESVPGGLRVQVKTE
jgi:hypothetical protein